MVVGIKTNKGSLTSPGEIPPHPQDCAYQSTQRDLNSEATSTCQKNTSRVPFSVLALLRKSMHKDLGEVLERETCHTKGSGLLSGTLSAFSDFEFETQFLFHHGGWKTKIIVELSRRLNQKQEVEVLDPRNTLSSGLQQKSLTFLCLVAHLESKLVTGAASQGLC